MTSPDIRQKLRAAALDKNDKTRADDEAMLDIIARRERGEKWPAIAALYGLKVDSLRANVRRLWLDYADSEAA